MIWEGRNRKGETGNQLMIFSFLFIMVIIGGGIVAGTAIYFGSGYDAREVSAEVFHNVISRCLNEKNIDFSAEKFKQDFYEKCGINKDVAEKHWVYDVKIDGLSLISFNNPKACLFSGAKKNINYPRCVESSFLKDGKRIEVIAGTNEFPRRLAG